MPNEHLKDALSQAGLTIEQFAEIIEVDPKTVQRWVNGRTPYPRHREKIARALDLTQHQLWPDAIPASDQGDEDRPGVEEITGLWPYGTEDGAPEAIDLLNQPVYDVGIIDPNGQILASAALRTALRHQVAADHVTIRVITAQNTAEVTALTNLSELQIISVQHRPERSTFIHVDGTILITYGLADPRPRPTLRVQRTIEHGFFDRLTDSFDAVWTHLKSTIGTTQPTAEPAQAAAPTHEPPRRWPGREQ